MDGCSRQNPAYRSATGEAPGDRGLSYSERHPTAACRPSAPGSDRRAGSGCGRPPGMRTYVRTMIVCVLLPRFELAVAAGGREALAAGPLALAPEIGREPLIGETSAAAEAYGVRAGLRLGEALARCPTLRLVAPDPAGVADAWERDRRRAGGDRRGGRVRAAPASPGSTRAACAACTAGDVEGVIAAGRAPRARPLARRADRRRLPSALRRRSGRGRVARRAPRAAGDRARRGRPRASPPISRRCRSRCWRRARRSPRCRRRWSASASRTLGELAALPRAALADRFGAAGLLARDLARGRDTPLRPRVPSERLQEVLELPESASGPQLERALGLLIDRVLARPERRGRTLRAVVLSAALVERRDVAHAADLPRGAGRPAPDAARARRPPHRAARPRRTRCACASRPSARRRATSARCSPSRRRSGCARLREAVRQTRAAAGPDAALRILAVDPDSRVPERRLALAPWEP